MVSPEYMTSFIKHSFPSASRKMGIADFRFYDLERRGSWTLGQGEGPKRCLPRKKRPGTDARRTTDTPRETRRHCFSLTKPSRTASRQVNAVIGRLMMSAVAKPGEYR